MKRYPSNEFTGRRVLTRLAWVAAWAVGGTPIIDAAAIISDSAATISADPDVMTPACLVGACNASNTNQTVNGVMFTGVISQRASGTGGILNLVSGGGYTISLDHNNTNVSGSVGPFSTVVLPANAATQALRFRRRRGAETGSRSFEDRGNQKPFETVSA
jgi:hypothetical protein